MNLLDHYRGPASWAVRWNSFYHHWTVLLAKALTPGLPARHFSDPYILRGANEFEAVVHDLTDGSLRPAGAVSLVSPTEKERTDARAVFLAKCERRLRNGIGVTVVDLVTTHPLNLHNALMDRLGHPGERLGSGLYAAAYRPADVPGDGPTLVTLQPLVIGRPLPTVPLWVSNRVCVAAPLHVAYEGACEASRMADRLAPPVV